MLPVSFVQSWPIWRIAQYFVQEPVIPYDLYTTFHNALRGFLLHRALITSLSYARTKLCRQLEAQVINAQSRRQASALSSLAQCLNAF